MAAGKAMKYYEVVPFALHLTPESLGGKVATLSDVADPRGTDK